MLQALIWFVFCLILLVIVAMFREVNFMFMCIFVLVVVIGGWLLVEVVVFLWPYAMGVK